MQRHEGKSCRERSHENQEEQQLIRRLEPDIEKRQVAENRSRDEIQRGRAQLIEARFSEQKRNEEQAR